MTHYSFTQQILAKLQVSISTERLGRYLGATKGDLKAAVELYELNLQLSQNLFGALHVYEVTLRNSMHDQLTQYFGQKNWYDKAPLGQWHRKHIDEAEEKCKPTASYVSTSRSGARTTTLSVPVTPGQTVAAVSLAFWSGLTARRYEQDLWIPCLRKAFPNIKANRVTTHQNLQDLQDLRNRIAHHERVLGSRGQLYIGVHHTIAHDQFGKSHHTRQDRLIRPELILTVVTAICRETATWLQAAAGFKECLAILAVSPRKVYASEVPRRFPLW